MQQPTYVKPESRMLARPNSSPTPNLTALAKITKPLAAIVSRFPNLNSTQYDNVEPVVNANKCRTEELDNV